MRRRLWILVACVLVIVGWWSLTGSGLSVERVGPKPAPGKKVVILLHGYGASGNDLVGLAQELSRSVPEVTFLMPAGPHRVGFNGRSWVPDFRAGSREEYTKRLAVDVNSTLAQLWKAIDGVRKRGVACKDITVGGFSLGGRFAAQLLATPRADCALGGALLLSAGGLRELTMPPLAAMPPVRVLVSHGSRDNVVSRREALSPGRYFVEGGHLVRLVSFDGRHEIGSPVREAIPRFIAGETVGEPLAQEL